MSRHLVLMRHAETEPARPGHRDLDRRLTETGLAQAAAAGRWLTDRYPVDAILCSPAVRTRETLAELGVGGTAEFPDWLYDAGGDTILDGIRGLPSRYADRARVGHAPGIPAVAHELADPAIVRSGSRDGHRRAASRPARSACYTVEQEWTELGRAALVVVRLAATE